MANVTISDIAGGEDTTPAGTAKLEVEVGGVSKYIQLANIAKGMGQIAFPATAVPSADANTLDDYEEGTFAVTLTCGTGTITINTSFDTLSYVKIGSLFTLQGYITVSAIDTPTGALTINGMPFTSANLGDASGRSAITVALLATSSDTGGAPMGTIAEGATIIVVREQTRSGTSSTVAGYIDTGSVIYVGGSYRVA